VCGRPRMQHLALVATLAVFPTLPVAEVALIVGIDRFMPEARLTDPSRR
jgi:Na+/H+-dicarboxylate symporter